MIIKPIIEPNRVGIMMTAEDKGPGIADVEKALQDRDIREYNRTVKGLSIGGAGNRN